MSLRALSAPPVRAVATAPRTAAAATGKARAAAAGGWGRAAAVAALATVALHAVVSLQHAHAPAFALVVAVMSLGCTLCSVRCLARPCERELTGLLGMSAAMVVLHVLWLLASGGPHVHGAAATATHADHGTSMLALALAEVLVAALCSVAMRSLRWTPVLP